MEQRFELGDDVYCVVSYDYIIPDTQWHISGLGWDPKGPSKFERLFSLTRDVWHPVGVIETVEFKISERALNECFLNAQEYRTMRHRIERLKVLSENENVS
jgi:hypothetical protein